MHWLRNLSCDRPIVSTEASSPESAPGTSSFQCPVFSLRPSCSCLRFLPRLPVTPIPPSIFPSEACFRRQFRRKVWPIQLSLLRRMVRMMFLSFLTICNTSVSHDRSSCLFHPTPVPYFKTFKVFLICSYFSKSPNFSTTLSYAPNLARH
jgi:hypothetical protein